MKKILILFFAITIIRSIDARAITPPIVDTHAIHIQVSKLLRDDRPLNFNTQFLNSIVFLNDSLAYYNPFGLLHLFEIRFDTIPHVQLLKDSYYNGHNFCRFLFIYNDNLYSFGGSGLFNKSSELLKYDFKKNHWYDIKISNLPKNTYYGISSWIYKNKLHTLYELKTEKTEYIYGYINLDSLNFVLLNRINHLNEEALLILNQSDRIHEGEIFDVYEIHGTENRCNHRLFNRETGEILHISFLEDRPCINGNSYIYTKDSTIYYRFDDGNIDSSEVDESIFFNKKSLNELYLSKPKKKNNFSIVLFVVLGILALFIGFLFYMYKKDNKALTMNEDDNLNNILNVLFEKIGTTLTKDELDELLGISKLTVDSIKSQRSRMFSSINDSGKLKIVRVKNQQDKRFFDYKIEKK
jgi:hypothetical protein